LPLGVGKWQWIALEREKAARNSHICRENHIASKLLGQKPHPRIN
jgi:hypothetical protein